MVLQRYAEMFLWDNAEKSVRSHTSQISTMFHVEHKCEASCLVDMMPVRGRIENINCKRHLSLSEWAHWMFTYTQQGLFSGRRIIFQHYLYLLMLLFLEISVVPWKI